MRNHFLKTVTMIGVLLVFSAVSGRAQSGGTFTVAVPFDFTVSGKTLPAGKYIVARSTQGSEGLMIRARDGRGGANLLTKSIQRGATQKQTMVVFTRYGNQYFLSQVWVSGKKTGRELFKSREEQQLERESAQRTVKPETITVAGRAK